MFRMSLSSPCPSRVTPVPVSSGQAVGQFGGRRGCWPLLGDDGQELRLKGVVDALIRTPRRRVHAFLRGLSFGSATSRGPTSVSILLLGQSRAPAALWLPALSSERL